MDGRYCDSPSEKPIHERKHPCSASTSSHWTQHALWMDHAGVDGQWTGQMVRHIAHARNCMTRSSPYYAGRARLRRLHRIDGYWHAPGPCLSSNLQRWCVERAAEAIQSAYPSRRRDHTLHSLSNFLWLRFARESWDPEIHQSQQGTMTARAKVPSLDCPHLWRRGETRYAHRAPFGVRCGVRLMRLSNNSASRYGTGKQEENRSPGPITYLV